MKNLIYKRIETSEITLEEVRRENIWKKFKNVLQTIPDLLGGIIYLCVRLLIKLLVLFKKMKKIVDKHIPLLLYYIILPFVCLYVILLSVFFKILHKDFPEVE